MRNTRFVLFLALLCVSFVPTARAITVAEAGLTVAGGALAGTLLGASTLPFYGKPGDHTKNIFIGAAIGAVTGVLIAGAQGFEETNEKMQDEEEEEAWRLTQPETSVALQYKPQEIPLWQGSITVAKF